MNLKDLNNKKICILGLGIENYALLQYLLKQKVACNITVCDARSKRALGTRYTAFAKTVHWKLGADYDAQLDSYDVIFRIAGYPLFAEPIIKAMMAGVNVSSPTKFFFDLCPTKNIIGVTGTKGKGTTASLIVAILKAGNKRVFFGGNIGIPMFGFISEIKRSDWVVLELSSFQLEDLHRSPHVAVITNFYQDHLAAADPNNPNYHKSPSAYHQAKANIYAHQTADDLLVINEGLREKMEDGGMFRPRSRVVYFGMSSLENQLVGEHNRRNVAAAVAVAEYAGVPHSTITKAVAAFHGLENRLEHVRSVDKVRYYNDSFSTTPDTAITALETFEPGRSVLIAGGASKGSDFSQLARTIKRRAKRVVLLLGQGSDELHHALKKINYYSIDHVSTMPQAVRLARKASEPGDVVLLSPACASFGLFKSYKERGEKFKLAVNKL